MVKALDRKLSRDLGQTWKMLLAVASIIALGIGCHVGMLSSARNLTNAQGDYYSTCRLADFWIDLKKAPVDEVHRLARIEGISELHTRIQHKVICDIDGEDEPVGGIMISMPADPLPVINGLVMRSGSYFSQQRSNEVIVAEKFAAARGLGPGDAIAIIMNGQRRELVVAGTAISAEFIYLTSPGSLIDEPKNYGLFYVKRSFAEDSFGFEGACNSVVGLMTPDARESAEVIGELADRLEPYGVFSSIPRSKQFSNMMLSSELQELSSMAYIFPAVFLVVAALVLNVLMTRLIEQQRTVIGTLKALGYSNRSLFFHYLKFGVAAGLAGGLLGGLIGYWLADAMTTMYLHYFSFPRLVNRFYPTLLVSGTLISMFCCLLGTLNGLRRGLKLKPAEAMRPPSPARGTAIFLERWKTFWGRLDIQWQMVLRGLVRRKGRTAISIFSAAMGASIVVMAFGLVDSMDDLITLQFDKVLRSDYHLSFSSHADESVLDEIRRLPGVTRAEPVFNLACSFENGNRREKGGVIGIGAGSELTVPRDVDGARVALPPTGLLMTERLMTKLGVRVGDTVRLVPVRGGHGPIPVEVAGGFHSSMGLMVYADIRWLNRIMGEASSASEARVLALQNPGQKSRFMRVLKEMPQLEAVTDIRRQKQALVEQFDGAMRVMAVVMIFFAAVIFFGAILNATLIGISERQREIATFGAIGYHQSEIARLFLRENMLTNMTGTLIALPMGYGLLLASMNGLQTDTYAFSAAMHPVSLLYTVLLAVAFVLTTQVVVLRNIRRINRVEALSSKE